MFLAGNPLPLNYRCPMKAFGPAELYCFEEMDEIFLNVPKTIDLEH